MEFYILWGTNWKISSKIKDAKNSDGSVSGILKLEKKKFLLGFVNQNLVWDKLWQTKEITLLFMKL